MAGLDLQKRIMEACFGEQAIVDGTGGGGGAGDAANIEGSDVQNEVVRSARRDCLCVRGEVLRSHRINKGSGELNDMLAHDGAMRTEQAASCQPDEDVQSSGNGAQVHDTGMRNAGANGPDADYDMHGSGMDICRPGGTLGGCVGAEAAVNGDGVELQFKVLSALFGFRMECARYLFEWSYNNACLLEDVNVNEHEKTLVYQATASVMDMASLEAPFWVHVARNDDGDVRQPYRAPSRARAATA